jgi:hypothetical protein
MLITGMLCRCCCVCGVAVQQGPQIVELLKKNPTVAIPVIIVRLEQKEVEWLLVSVVLR